MFDYFEPFFTFRFILFLTFMALFFYDLFDLMLWYRHLPKLAQKYIKIKLFTLNWGGLKRELMVVISLFCLGFLVFLFHLTAG